MSRAEQRAAARLAAVQALYQMDVAKTGINEVVPQFEAHWIGQEIEGDQYKPAEVAFFRSTVEGVLAHQTEVDRLIDATLEQSWPLARVEAVLRAVLRAGTFELMQRPDVPARVSIKEYADVAGAFLAGDEVGMVNAVLDRLARRLRPDEMRSLARSG